MFCLCVDVLNKLGYLLVILDKNIKVSWLWSAEKQMILFSLYNLSILHVLFIQSTG